MVKCRNKSRDKVINLVQANKLTKVHVTIYNFNLSKFSKGFALTEHIHI